MTGIVLTKFAVVWFHICAKMGLRFRPMKNGLEKYAKSSISQPGIARLR